jgi:hypothetical protein
MNYENELSDQAATLRMHDHVHTVTGQLQCLIANRGYAIIKSTWRDTAPVYHKFETVEASMAYMAGSLFRHIDKDMKVGETDKIGIFFLLDFDVTKHPSGSRTPTSEMKV